jgi:hypothetical protein
MGDRREGQHRGEQEDDDLELVQSLHPSGYWAREPESTTGRDRGTARDTSRLARTAWWYAQRKLMVPSPAKQPTHINQAADL